MAQSKHEIVALLSEAGLRPRKRFGQNFMIDMNLVRLVADAGQIAPDDLVIEVGPGTGSLTEELLERAGHVLAVEIDRDLAAILRQRFGQIPALQLIEGDALAGKHSIHPQLEQAIAESRHQNRTVRLVSNLPYNIASPLIVDLLIAGVSLLAFTVQREVAHRLSVAAGDADYGPLSVMTQLLARVQVLRTLPKQAFWPMPNVESALVLLERDDRLGDLSHEFGRFISAVFSSRRKTLRNALARAGVEGEKVLQTSGIDPQLRPEDLTPQQWLGVFRQAGGNP